MLEEDWKIAPPKEESPKNVIKVKEKNVRKKRIEFTLSIFINDGSPKPRESSTARECTAVV